MTQTTTAQAPSSAGLIFQEPKSMRSSVSAYLTVSELLPFRNAQDLVILRRIFGELCLAGLAVLSLIEAVARTIFYLISPASLVACCTSQTRSWMYWSAFGALFSTENCLNCLVALITNLYQETLVYDNILPCFDDLNGIIIG